MRNATIITLAICLIGCLAIGYDADAGLFNRGNKCTPNNLARPDKPFPIDELFGPIVDDGVGPACPTAPTPTTECPPVDIDAIVAAVLAKLPPVKMEIHHPDGNVYTQAKPLGEAIRLRLVPQ